MDIAALNASAMGAFGTPELVLYRPRSAAGPFYLRAIFDRFHIEVMVDGGHPVSQQRAQLQVLLADVPPGVELAARDRVQIDVRGEGIAFDITDVRPDGLGWAVLPLGFIDRVGP